MKKVLIIGSTGMLGHVVYLYFKTFDELKIINTSRNVKLSEETIILDLFNSNQLYDLIKKEKPEHIINCSGILIKESLEFPERAIYINAYIPHLLSRYAKEFGLQVIQISTDCVFSGKGGNYLVNDFKDADDVYGLSKSLGELTNMEDLTLRTSIIGPEIKTNGTGLFHWLITQSDVVKGYKSVFWSGVTTLELAKIIKNAIDLNLKGLYNISNNNKISKFDLLHLIKNIYNLKTNIIPDISKKADKSLINNNLIEQFKVNDYSKMLTELKDFIMGNKLLYNHYKNI